MTEIITALISTAGTAFGAWLLYLWRRAVQRSRSGIDTGKAVTERERSLSEGWADFATHMETQLRATQEDLSAVRIQLVACQREARDAHNEAYVVRRLADSLEDELVSLRKRMNHLEA